MPLSARAEIYICKDGAGHTITSDRPVPECAKQVLRVMSDGLVRREIAAPLTPEQQRQKQVEQDRQRAAAVAAEEQRQLDRILLARYQSEPDIEAARKRALQPAQDAIAGSSRAIASAQKEQAGVKAAGDSLKNKPLPLDLRSKLDDAASTIQREQSSILDQSATMADVNARFDGTLKRFRELHSGDAPKPAVGTNGSVADVQKSAKTTGKR
jgi:hypothetical protein